MGEILNYFPQLNLHDVPRTKVFRYDTPASRKPVLQTNWGHCKSTFPLSHGFLPLARLSVVPRLLTLQLCLLSFLSSLSVPEDNRDVSLSNTHTIRDVATSPPRHVTDADSAESPSLQKDSLPFWGPLSPVRQGEPLGLETGRSTPLGQQEAVTEARSSPVSPGHDDYEVPFLLGGSDVL